MSRRRHFSGEGRISDKRWLEDRGLEWWRCVGWCASNDSSNQRAFWDLVWSGKRWVWRASKNSSLPSACFSTN